MSVSGSVASSPLQAAEVWVDLNGDGIHQAQEPLTQTEPDGSFRLAVPADLLAADGAGADRLPLVASGGIDSLSGQPMGGLRLLGTSGDGALTPLTTLPAMPSPAAIPPWPTSTPTRRCWRRPTPPRPAGRCRWRF